MTARLVVIALVILLAVLAACPGPEAPRNPDDGPGPAEDSTGEPEAPEPAPK